ncbi:hypothetical protein I6G82_08275 [Lysinibacillus macroides]|uniref:Uncharacterized protein n=1 Tax=Lysinibacillus macroides TaxID=33935 RepID=A0A0M9DHI7_9BACI|nr:hypothetical protein [Lysinibacillus macroides]KOY81588.1 hypothetical protein ADM90_14410 [Lysinibacillus macroides]QPR69568.1 hypothetical protein I6G82_08275 [Lysinibacillus macroides]
MERRKRLADGSFGELEKVGSAETAEEKAVRLEQENKLLKLQNQANVERMEFVEELIAEIAMKVYE